MMLSAAAGKELYLIPGIDMLNHMTDDGGSPRFVANASLDLSTQVTPAEGGPQDAPRKCFVLTAGAWSSTILCSIVLCCNAHDGGAQNALAHNASCRDGMYKRGTE